MRKYGLWAYIVFMTLQIHAADHGEENEISSDIKMYSNSVLQLSDIAKECMEKLQVRGRDYSKFVLKQKNTIESSKYYAEQYVLNTLSDYTNQLKNAYRNQVNRFFTNDQANGSFYRGIISRQRVEQAASEQMMQELEPVRQHLSDVNDQIKEFYDFPIDCLNERNDCYVSCWFDLRSVGDALVIPDERMTPEQVITHFQGVDKALTDFTTSLTEYQEFQSAFLTSCQNFEQVINIRGVNWRFQCAVEGETLVREMVNVMSPVVNMIYQLKSKIESYKPSASAAPETPRKHKGATKKKRT